ncbi:MAG: PAS domain S-box protein [Dehalococcoidales bacterium]|nr:PAS domain S-box protein [Dehalococcoidales bacterium]
MKDKDSDKTKRQLIQELEAMRRRIAGLEASAAESQFMERDRAGEVKKLFVQGPVVVFRWRAEEGWPVEYVSSNLESQFGYRPADFTDGGISYRDIIHPEDIPHILEELERCDENSKEYLRQEYRIRSKDGGYRWVYDYTLLIRGSTGTATHYLGYITDITESKQAGEAVRESEAKYRFLTENMTDIVFTIDLNMKTTYVSPSVERILGFTPEERMRQQPQDQLTPTSYKLVAETLQRELERERATGIVADKLFTLELEYYHKNGSVIITEVTAHAIRDEQGKPIGVYGLCRDITERKKAGEQLRESEGKYRLLANNAADVIWTMDIDNPTQLIYISPSVKQLLGYSIEEAKSKKMEEIFTDTSFKRAMLVYAEEMAKKDDFTTGGAVGSKTIEFELKRADGSTVPVDINYSLIRGPDDQPVQMLAVARDITERKRMEEELEQERALFVSGPTIVFRWLAADGWPIDYVSPNVYDLLGYTAKELMDGKHLFGDMLHLDDVRRIAEANEKAEQRKGQRILMGEYRILTKNGEIKWVHEHTMLVKDDQGAVKYHHGYVTDITEQKKTEAEKREMERKAQVTSRLASVGEMVSGIAHEINNPLTSVVGFSELLMEKDLPEDLRKDVEIIHGGSQRAADIVKRLLTFARQHKPERTCTGINEILESTLALRKYALETSNIEVITLLDTELPWTVADAGQLQQVFLNIIVNAETAMKKAHGRGRLTIRTEQAGDRIRISFADDGPGIAGENLERIFDPFFTTREVGEGTGLGLSLAHGIVVEHNGALYAESEEGKGATFFVELPVVMEEEKKIERVEEVETAGKTVGGRILVVDDEPAIMAFLKKLLGGEGYDVATAGSGREALEMTKEQRYNLIICDIKMPGLSGAELYDELGGIAPSLQKRVIFITGDVIGPATNKFLKATGVPHINKPFDIAELKKEINRVIVSAG